MIASSQLRVGMAIRFENQTYKVMSTDYQPGQGKMGGVMHARLRNVATGTLREHGFRSELKLDEVPVEKRTLQFLYRDGDECCFMDVETYDQTAVPASLIGDQVRLLAPELAVSVEFIDNRAVAITLPDVVELKVADTAPASHATQDSTWKPAKLENGLDVVVPQFVKTGDLIRVNTADAKYVDRAKAHGR